MEPTGATTERDQDERDLIELDRREAFGDEEESELPDGIELAAAGKAVDAEQEADATEWLMASDGPSDEEIEPTKLRVNVGTLTEPKIIEWFVVPLPDAEFRKFQRATLGNRTTRRRIQQGDLTAVDQYRYNLMVVAAATVKPDLKKAAEVKGVDVLDVLENRFRAKSRLIMQIAGVVSDISGGDEADVEVVAGN